MAAYVIGDSGSIRDLEYALWEVRVTVLLQLRHWKLRAWGAWTVPLPELAVLQTDRLFELIPGVQAGVQM